MPREIPTPPFSCVAGAQHKPRLALNKRVWRSLGSLRRGLSKEEGLGQGVSQA